MKSLTIATRKSPLALWQANLIKQKLNQLFPDLQVVLLELTTTGDQKLQTALADSGGKGLFIKELEQALLEKKADIAVHSMKDMPAVLAPEFCLPAFCKREDARDAFLSLRSNTLAQLPLNAVIGTASARRQCQILAYRPDLKIKLLRGNVDTRIRRLDEGEYDAIILAAAGLKRLGLAERITEYLPVDFSLPAIGQGIIGIECLQENTKVRELLKNLDDEESRLCLGAERALNAFLGGGCHAPIAGYAVLQGDNLYLQALVGALDGSVLLKASATGKKQNFESIAHTVGQDLLNQGAAVFLK